MTFHSKPTTFIGHVKIKVYDIERSLDFYENILGFSVLDRTERSVNLTVDGKTSFLSLVQPENIIATQRGTTGLYHFAILLPTVTDLANIVIHLVKNDIRFGASDHLVSEALYLADPDGNEIEIYRDRPASEWGWQGDEVDMATIQLNFEELLKHATPDEPWEKMPEGAIMGHVHLHVSDIESTEKFYVDGLGMDVVKRYGPQALFLSYGKYHHHLGANTWNGVGAPQPAINSVGLDYYTLVFDNEDVRAEAIQNLEKIGAEVKEIDGRFTTIDPSGNKIILDV